MHVTLIQDHFRNFSARTISFSPSEASGNSRNSKPITRSNIMP
ncbi:hypothetical protein SAMN05444380_1244 [Thermophagus xiamenensis]|uniref:Uncharacterized protein n=1 Tax=Thermophagus xiamenensis TaxID=385682 RepID=A0A1I2ES06_9BACT|nr:hypothetical protein SAMN05444380_1244 [Thermophagus xiamenensis]